MSVVDHRAAFVTHGRRGSSARVSGGSSRRFEAPILVPSQSNDRISNTYPVGSGAFRSHGVSESLRDLSKDTDFIAEGRKLQGLHTEAARELSESRRGSGYGNVFDDNLGTVSTIGKHKPTSRHSWLGGVSYGPAAVKRDPDLEARRGEPMKTILIDPALGGTTISSSLDDSYQSERKRRSISAGEGLWLVKANVERRKSSRSSIKTLEIERKDSERHTPGIAVEEDDVVPPLAEAKPKAKKKGKVKFAGKSNMMTASGNTHSTKTDKVKFSTVSIRYFPTILGNNPFVTSGPPLELSWECEASSTENGIPVDRYESVRGPLRRSEWDLALSRGERESRLLEQGFTREEIAAAIRETSRIRAQRANTVLNLKMAPVEEFTDGVRRRGAKMVGLRKSSNWMYNEWKNKNQASAGRSHFSNTRADIVFQQEESRRVQGMPEYSRKELLANEDKSKGGAFVNKLLLRPSSPLNEREPIEEECPESPRREFTGPAFGITQRSLSIRVGLGDSHYDPNHSVVFDNGGNGIAFGDNGTVNSGGALWPFALIKVVYPHSPASEAGLIRGDRILKLGNITALNHDHCKAIPELGQVAATKECALPMTVMDGQGNRRDVTIRPHKWSGRGVFGFLFRELDTEHEE